MTKQTAAILALILLTYGIVGRMDYEDAIAGEAERAEQVRK